MHSVWPVPYPSPLQCHLVLKIVWTSAPAKCKSTARFSFLSVIFDAVRKYSKPLTHFDHRCPSVWSKVGEQVIVMQLPSCLPDPQIRVRHEDRGSSSPNLVFYVYRKVSSEAHFIHIATTLLQHSPDLMYSNHVLLDHMIMSIKILYYITVINANTEATK